MRKVVILIALFLVLLSFPCHAAEWCCCKSGEGQGNTDGTDWDNCFNGLSDISWGGVSAGDTVYLDGGSTSKTYDAERLVVGASGSQGSPITIAIDAEDSSHNGTAIFDYDSLGNSGTGAGFAWYGRDYITIDGNVNDERHISVRNLRNTSDREEAVALDGFSHSIVKYVDIQNCNNGIEFMGSSTGVEVDNCRVQARGDVCIRIYESASATWDLDTVKDSVIEMLFNESVGGPDGIQCGHGITVYGCSFAAIDTELYTGGQHPDCIQLTGNYAKIYGNDFKNIEDSGIDFDAWDNHTPHDIWIYNNLFRTTRVYVDSWPESFRLYCTQGDLESITNVKIFNNTFVDNIYECSVCWGSWGGNPTGVGIEIKNNIFYQGDNPYRIWDSTNFTSESFDFSNNIYYYSSNPSDYIDFRGTEYSKSEWISGIESSGITDQPTFVDYELRDIDNDLHLDSSDTVATDAGADLSSYFTTDYDAVSRPQGAAWDVGAYEYESDTQKIITGVTLGVGVSIQ